MFFGILLTPKQFLGVILLGAAAGFMFMAPWLFGAKDTRLDKFPEKIAAITQTYEAANAEIEKKTKLAESAVLKTKVLPLVISSDARIRTTVNVTVKNIIDKPAVAAYFLIKIHSSSMDGCIAKLSWNPRFDTPLLPGASTDVELRWQTLGLLAIKQANPKQSSNCGGKKIQELIGTHQVSKVEAIVNAYLVTDPQSHRGEFILNIGPTAVDNRNRLKAKKKLDYCAPVIALVNEKKFAEEDFENHAICFKNIGLHPPQPSFKEMSEAKK